MALNLSTLTSSATSGDVLAEALTTTADFLENVPVFRNIARGSNKGGDAKQSVSLNQPKALPLIDGKGYCYLPVTTGNAPAVTFPTIGTGDDFVLEMDVYLVSATSFHFVSGADANHRLGIHGGQFHGPFSIVSLSSPLAVGVSNIKIERTSGTLVLKQNDSVLASTTSFNSFNFTYLSFNGQFSTSILPINGYIQKATLSIGGTEQLNVDFTATNIRHGDTKFKCATGQVVTINQSGNDPSTIIKKPVLRFANTPDGSSTINLKGFMGQRIGEGYLFAVFSVLGDGGAGSSRIVSFNRTGTTDVSNLSYIAAYGDGTSLYSYIGGVSNIIQHLGLYQKEMGDFLFEHKFKSGTQSSRVNNADLSNNTADLSTVSSEEFNIAANASGGENAAIDLEFLALFPSSITDDQADSVRNYINNRNVFDLKDGFGYYFYDAQKAPVGAISSGSSSWNGGILGSDNGDANKLATQGTGNDQPVSDGYVVTFADNSDHLTITNPNQAGWQVVGTSLGTFAYRVNANAVTELNLLGNAGGHRSVGDSYGIILLPESATGADIEAARRLLIDRGAADGTTGGNYYAAWLQRPDIVEFKSFDASTMTVLTYAFAGQVNLVSFPAMSFPNATTLDYAFDGLSSLTSFGEIDAKNGTNFTGAFRGSSALTSFPAGAKLGTEATTGVNFTDAWRDSGLQSFPALDLSTGNDFKNTFYLCSNLTEISADAKFGTAAGNVDFDSAFASTGLTAFPALDLSTGTKFYATWFGNNSMSEFGAIDARLGDTFADAFKNCSALTSFPSGANLGSEASNVVFSETWRSSGLTSFRTPLNTGAYLFRAWRDCSSLSDFSAEVLTNWNPSSITTGVFNEAWDGCTSLTAQSVGNILQSIDASNQHGTDDGTSTGNPLGDSGIDIDYDGTTLSAATNSAVTSLKAKGWSIIVNNVTL